MVPSERISLQPRLMFTLNLYWDVAGGADEREEKEKFLLEIMQLAKSHKLKFYDSRIRQQVQ